MLRPPLMAGYRLYGLIGRLNQQPQQTGMPFIMTQQVQPAFIMADMQSQEAWIIAEQALSPLVQVIVQPSSVVSQWHMPMTRLQQQATMPLTCMQHEHIPPASIVQRFCIIATAILSSLVQTIFIPPGHFDIAMLHRGTIIMFVPVEPVDGMPIVPIPWAPIPIAFLSIITALVMLQTPRGHVGSRKSATERAAHSPPLFQRTIDLQAPFK